MANEDILSLVSANRISDLLALDPLTISSARHAATGQNVLHAAAEPGIVKGVVCSSEPLRKDGWHDTGIGLLSGDQQRSHVISYQKFPCFAQPFKWVRCQLTGTALLWLVPLG